MPEYRTRMKLLFVINQLCKGGAESSLVAFLSALPQDRYEVSLVVYDERRGMGGVSLVNRLPQRVRLLVGNSPITSPAIREFVSQTEYDWAISVGEWHSPEWVMRHAKARRKAVWIHADITSAAIPKAEDLFDFDECVDRWICVSEVQRRILGREFPFLADRCATVHNPVDAEEIRSRAVERVVLPACCAGHPLVVMVGNLRPAKNYLRAVKAAARLRQRGSDAVWLVIGNASDDGYLRDVRREIDACGMTDRFLLVGADENPWKYMAKADVIVSSSDTESWCLALSEALILGKWIVATRTDGASEQIQNGVNGFLCEFTPEALADAVAQSLTDASVRACKAPRPTFDPVMEFSRVLETDLAKRPKAKVLVIMDDANYRGGAHKATVRMLQTLCQRGLICDVLSGRRPSLAVRNEFFPIRIRHVSSGAGYAQWFDQSGFREVLSTRGIPFSAKLQKLNLSLSRRLGLREMPKVAEACVVEDEEKIISEYPSVCVISEGSRFREVVADLPTSIRRIQLIHTYYTLWRTCSDWTRHLTEGDGTLYSKMDVIGLIGLDNVRAFARVYPHLANKAHPFHNVIDVHPQPVADAVTVATPLRLVTVARLETEKDIPRMIQIAQRLVADGLDFVWSVYGDGSLRGSLEKQVRRCGLGTKFRLAGYDADAVVRMREADLFVLLSHYEGLPNVIYESMIVGTPVLATSVGGIPEQIDDGVNGQLVADDAESIYQAMKALLSDPHKILSWRRNLKSYSYDNERAIAEFQALLLGVKA